MILRHRIVRAVAVVSGALLLLVAGNALLSTPAVAQDATQAGIRLKRSLVVVTGADPASGQVLVMEKLLLQNDTGAPYQPARWEDSAVRIRLPQTAIDPSLDAGPPGADFVPVPGQEGTFALAAPLPPGEQSLAVSYAIPYSAASVKIGYRPPMPAEMVQVLLPAAAGPELRPVGRALRPGQELALGSQKYLVLEGTQLAAGADASFELRRLPSPAAQPGGRALPGTSLAEAPLVATAALLLGAALLYGLVRR